MAFSQNDPQWKNTRLGNSTSSGDTIGNYGCYVTAIANVCEWAGHDLDPVQINDICKQNGWFGPSTPGDNDLINRDDIPALLCSNLGFIGRTNWDGPTDINFFNDASSPDIAYIIKIDASPKAGIQAHFTMVWAKPDANDLTIDDSWDGVRKALSHYGSPSVIIQSAMKFIKVAPPAPEPVVVPEPIPVTPPPPPPSPIVITPPLTATNTEQYSLVVSVPCYPSPGTAASRAGSVGTLSNGAYYVTNQKMGMYNLTKTLGQSQGTWINPADNVVAPPKPLETTTDIMKSWRWGYPTHEPAEYRVVRDLLVRDMVHSSPPIWIYAGHNIDIYGVFIKDSKTYLRPLTSTDDKGLYSWYGIETTNVNTGAPYLENEYDITDIIQSGYEHIYDKTIKTIEGIYKAIFKRKK